MSELLSESEIPAGAKGRRNRDKIWSALALLAAALGITMWISEPPRPTDAPRPGPVVAEAFLCDRARAGAGPQAIGKLVAGGGAVHGNVQVAASDYVAGRGSILKIVAACAAVGA